MKKACSYQSVSTWYKWNTLNKSLKNVSYNWLLLFLLLKNNFCHICTRILWLLVCLSATLLKYNGSHFITTPADVWFEWIVQTCFKCLRLYNLASKLVQSIVMKMINRISMHLIFIFYKTQSNNGVAPEKLKISLLKFQWLGKVCFCNNSILKWTKTHPAVFLS